MLKLNNYECFDLNILGMLFILIVFLIVLFYSMSVYLIIGLEILLIVYAYYLIRQIKANKNVSVLVNTENQWFVELDGQSAAVQLKDYWVFSGLIFFWLKGEKYSVSFVVTRSIIGAPKFSQLRAKIL